MVKLKKYTFLIGENIMYNQTVIRRVRWFNPFARSGLCNIETATFKAPSVQIARISAAVYFETRHRRYAHIMGSRTK